MKKTLIIVAIILFTGILLFIFPWGKVLSCTERGKTCSIDFCSDSSLGNFLKITRVGNGMEGSYFKENTYITVTKGIFLYSIRGGIDTPQIIEGNLIEPDGECTNVF